MISKSPSNSNVVELNRNLKDKEAEIELLQQTFTAIGSELNLDKIFNLVSQQARELVNAETLLIPLLDENCETYTYRGGSGENSEEIIGESLPLDFGVCGWVWKHKKPWWRGVLDDLSEEEKNKWEGEAGTMIMVPLQGQKHFLGGIAALRKVGGGEFTKRDLILLQMFASIVSIAIENALTVKKIESANQITEEYRVKLQAMNKQLVESSKELEQLSLFDAVTSLPNRSLFHDRLSRNLGMASLNNESIGLLLVDVNRFKQINDALGHAKGDVLLKNIAERFSQHIGAKETLARLGGDEFVFILPNHNKESSVQRAKDIQKILDEPFKIDDSDIAVSVSIGVSVFPDHGESIGRLLSHADSAMYVAKDNNVTVYLYDPDKDLYTRGQLTMVADLRSALEKNKFELYYQPKISVETNKVVSAEALGRWNSDIHGFVPPGIFVPMLEQNSLIDEFTYWAIETALEQSKIWREADKHFRVAVNVSPQTLMNPDFIKNIMRTVKNTVDGECLTFEITENLFLSEYDRLFDVLEHIKYLGIKLSIDDYGTGYSSLSRLRKLPVSELKIDQSFIKEMTINKDDEAIVRSTIELAHNLGLTVVAEGVETQQALDLLKTLGCDTAQGYLMSKPLRVDAFNYYYKNT